VLGHSSSWCSVAATSHPIGLSVPELQAHRQTYHPISLLRMNMAAIGSVDEMDEPTSGWSLLGSGA
jgi:hypothetical protein